MNQDVVDGRDIGSRRRSELLEGTLDSNVVDGRVGRDTRFGRCCWKVWKGRCQLEGLERMPDSDVVAGRFGRDVVNWKGCRIWTLLLEGLEGTLSIGRVGRGVVNWKGWKGRRIRALLLEGLEGTLLMEGLEGTPDSDVVDGRVGKVGRDVGFGRC